MKVYLNRNLFDIHGEKVRELPKGKTVDPNETSYERLGVMLVEGLLRDLQQDNAASGSIKMKRYQLAQKITVAMKKDTTPELCMEISSEDVAMVKGRLATFLPTALLGPVFEAIEPSLAMAEEEVG